MCALFLPLSVTASASAPQFDFLQTLVSITAVVMYGLFCSVLPALRLPTTPAADQIPHSLSSPAAVV